jgi:hypothetical protein
MSTLFWSPRLDTECNTLRRMSGKYIRPIISGGSVGGTVITVQGDGANMLAPSFSTVCSSNNHGPGFRAIKDMAETTHFNLTARVAEDFNAICSLDELLAPLDRWRNKFLGPDGINNEMHSHLQPDATEIILTVYNRIRTEIQVPDA